TQAGSYRVQLAFDADQTDLDAELIDPNGHPVGFLYQSSIDEDDTFNLSETGGYLLRVHGYEMPCPAGNGCRNWSRPSGVGDYLLRVSAN
ncbi:MAG: hypothetical protein KC561_11500, partial [Myxococcales bacterium]|nr:hypothetical protein [Myxococcales bacterium]